VITPTSTVDNCFYSRSKEEESRPVRFGGKGGGVNLGGGKDISRLPRRSKEWRKKRGEEDCDARIKTARGDPNNLDSNEEARIHVFAIGGRAGPFNGLEAPSHTHKSIST